MEKKLLKEINQIRNLMRLPLLNEQPQTVDVLTSLLTKVGKAADEKIVTKIGVVPFEKTAQEIYDKFIIGFKSKMSRADKELAVKFFQTKEGKTFLNSYKSAIKDFQKAGGDEVSVAGHNSRVSRIETAINSATPPKPSAGVGSVSSGKQTITLADLDIAAQEVWLPNYKEAQAKLKIAFPKAPSGKYTELINAIKAGTPKNEQDFLRKFESVLADYRGPYAEYVQKKANKISIGSKLWSQFKSLPWGYKVLIALGGTGLLSSYGFDVPGTLSNMIQTIMKGGKEVAKGVKGGIESGIEGSTSPESETTPTPGETPPTPGETPPPSRETPRREEPRTPDNTSAQGGDLDRL